MKFNFKVTIQQNLLMVFFGYGVPNLGNSDANRAQYIVHIQFYATGTDNNNNFS